ncbi:MAG: prephenate dehydrogenase/arogenate dehydrogenase family protein [Acidimicrobiia bacterium]|nr:prephenate dehydrogenase/arogenate dehydrogenase family protein [Acidimicrobiia bacterium]MDH5237991.1 prephenate dehydrogenase/arogenate dehydrogenase family protein [Acidimicrobiia bacterium]
MPDGPNLPRRANVIGTGLIGGSIGLALAQRGWTVSAQDADPSRADRAVELGAAHQVGLDADAEITFVATPVGVSVPAIHEALTHTSGLVTDVGSVKTVVSAAVRDRRFVAGHPMAGSELAGVDAASADLFDGALWVLCPTSATADERAFSAVRSVIADLGAEVVVLTPERHDELVAVVSHVPHLTAATLMTLAADRSVEQGTLLRLAAGGFRDMTRIAAGHPGIWPDICVANSDAITAVLDELILRLQRVRGEVANGDRAGLTSGLELARTARTNLPARGVHPEELCEVRLAIPDRPGELARVVEIAGDADVNVYDIEIAHGSEGDRGVLILVVEAEAAEEFVDVLRRFRYRPRARALS